jgi:hypothetical protein
MWDFLYKVDYGPLVCTVVGTLLILGGTVWSNILSSHKEKVVSEKNEKIVQLTEENNHLITGGDSYPSVMPSVVVKSREKARTVIGFIISNSNDKYPLYDVKATILDIDKYRQLVEANKTEDINKKGDVLREARREAMYNLDVGNLGPSQALADTIELEMPLTVDKREFRIETSARNGNTMQEVRFLRQSDEKITIEKELFVNGNKIEK